MFRLQPTASGKVTDDEFVARLQRVFETLDKNGDKALTSGEYPDANLIKDADTDNDGVLSTKEFRVFHGRRFDKLNIPKGIATSRVGDVTVRVTHEISEQHGVVAFVLNFDVTGVARNLRCRLHTWVKRSRCPSKK